VSGGSMFGDKATLQIVRVCPSIGSVWRSR
jgi:hypothetical protein